MNTNQQRETYCIDSCLILGQLSGSLLIILHNDTQAIVLSVYMI